MDRENNIYNLAPLISEYVFMWVKKIYRVWVENESGDKETAHIIFIKYTTWKYLNNSVAVCEYFS